MPVTPVSSSVPSPITPDFTFQVTLHYLEASRAHRICWLLEELHLPYELVVYFRKESKQAPDSLKVAHPLGKSPVLKIQPRTTLADFAPTAVVLAESANIVEYLLRNYASRADHSIEPERYEEQRRDSTGVDEIDDANPREESEAFLRYRFLMHFAEGSMMPPLVFSVVLDHIRNLKKPFIFRPILRRVADRVATAFTNPNIQTNLALLESYLSEAKAKVERGRTTVLGSVVDNDEPYYICGTRYLTAADIMLEYALDSVKGLLGFTEDKFPLLWQYVDRLHQNEAYKRAVKKATEAMGKPFTLKL